MDTLWFITAGTVLEGTCAVKLARKFGDKTPAWKFFVPIYNILNYGKFSLMSTSYLQFLALIQTLDLALNFTQKSSSIAASAQPWVSIVSYFLWAVMISKIAARLGQSFGKFLAVMFLSAVASNFAVVALLQVLVPSFHAGLSPIPLWAEIIALLIMSLPFVSLAFDKQVLYDHEKDLP